MNAPIPGEILHRSRLMTLLHTALNLGETRFVRRLALSWLASFPGDLPVRLLHARALLTEGHPQQAIDILEEIIQVDVEYQEAYQILEQAQETAGQEIDLDLDGILYIFTGQTASGNIPDWAKKLRGARQAFSVGTIDRAHDLIHHALLANPNSPLVAVTHLQIMASRIQSFSSDTTGGNTVRSAMPGLANVLAIRDLAEAYHQRWPFCAQIKLLWAQALMECNEDDAGVSLIHQTAVQDVTGQVAIRLWGNQHIYRSLWPEKLNILHDQPIPAAVAASLGWNQLPESSLESGVRLPVDADRDVVARAPKSKPDAQTRRSPAAQRRKPASVSHTSETLRSVQDELDKLASRVKQPSLVHSDGRFPVYVIFTTRYGLVTQYSASGALTIDAEMKNLARTTQTYGQWSAMVFYADLGALGVPPVKPTDPWALKLALIDLDTALAQRGERIGAVLIVGGPQVVPFHHLPNPVDDADSDVPSDNPYATSDENYFIPEWPVGRLPGDASNDPAPLIKAIRAIINQRMAVKQAQPWYARWWRTIRKLFRLHIAESRPSLGYTAAVWRRASLAAFRPVGDGKALKISPPVEKVNGEQWTLGSLGYFNLHGVVDAAEWFGQRDPADPSSGPDYPVVLSPANIVNSGRSPQVVFSEACYGAHILQRSVEQALALKFLASGSLAVVGSTCTSYGSVTLPLIAADLLARLFWKYLDEGCPAGEATRRAKVSLAREMHKRQGYLDGEDQKTLISFVFYGDPLAQPAGDARHFAKTLIRSAAPPSQPAIVCDRYDPECTPAPISTETLAQVKSIVAQYLPGMSDAAMSMTIERAECHASGHACPTAYASAKTLPAHPPARKTILLSKHIEQNHHSHNQYARLTLDEYGKLVKLAVSR